MLSGKGRGGGVLIACRDIFSPILCSELTLASPNFEIIFIFARFSFGRVLISCVYMSPGSAVTVYDDLCSLFDCYVSRRRDCPRIIFLGDFNIPSYSDSVEVSSRAQSTIVLHSFCNRFNLVQHNNILNQDGRTLDLVFSSIPVIIQFTPDFTVSVDPYHPPLSCLLCRLVSRPPVLFPTGLKYNFCKGNY